MTNQWIVGLVGLGLGFVTMGRAIATPDTVPYNCLTRAVWSPEKQAWCREQGSMVNPVDVAEEAGVLVAVDGLLSDRLQQTEWILEDLNGTGVMDQVQTTLQFDEEGDRISGSGGCNRYFSGIEFEEDGATATRQAISLEAIGSTRMACPPAVMDQESRYFQSLQTAQRIEWDGPYLFIYSEGQEQPMRFTQVNAAQPIPGLW